MRGTENSVPAQEKTLAQDGDHEYPYEYPLITHCARLLVRVRRADSAVKNRQTDGRPARLDRAGFCNFLARPGPSPSWIMGMATRSLVRTRGAARTQHSKRRRQRQTLSRVQVSSPSERLVPLKSLLPSCPSP